MRMEAATAVYSGDSSYAASSGTAIVTLNLPSTGALVLPFVSPNPIYENGTANNWTYMVSLTEKAGVAATLTGFTIGGNNDLSLFTTRGSRAREQSSRESPLPD